MSAVVDQAVAVLNSKVSAGSFDGAAKFVLTGEGSILMDEAGARAGEGPADVTMTADADTFRSILGGELSATSAFMTGRLSVEGDMGLAMKLASLLA